MSKTLQHRFIVALAASLTFTLLLSACGRSVMVTVVDERSGKPIPNASVLHERAEWRCIGIALYQFPIAKARGKTDEHGQITFKNVRDNDTLTTGGSVVRTWFHPLQPIAKTSSGPDTNAAENYRRLNENASPDRITLPIRPESPK